MDGNEPMQDMADALRDGAQRWIEGAFPRARRAACIAGEEGAAEAVWRDLADMGMMGLMVPEAAGGLGAGATVMCRVAEAFGHGLMSEPWIPVAVGAVSILSDAGRDLTALGAGTTRPVPAWIEPDRRWCRRPSATLIDGSGCISGTKTVVWGASLADTVLVSALDSSGAEVIARVSAEEIIRKPYRMWDGCDAAELVFRAAPAEILLDGSPASSALDRALDLMTLAICAEALGAMARALDLTREHLRTRVQFGRPLAANQALRHRVAEAWVEADLARALITRVAREFEKYDAAGRRRMTAAAKAQTGAAARRMAEETVQMHGGIGITDDAEISHLHRRLVAIDLSFGSTAVQVASFRGGE